MSSFQAAAACGADMIETDIHMTRDKELVLIHDNCVDRTTDGKGFIREMTLPDIKKLDARSWKNGRFTGLRIPTLGEFLDSVQDNADLLFNFELKDYPEECGISFCYESVNRTLSMIREYGLENRCVINSFSAHI
ncbi:MAG: glycerophosphodiester phosphodiesterase family protein [Clostridiaceae bacterium]|nr:glycerophosphodiester phosphodiesterase family protein [Clostridiaceae bacterium]